jgi:small subunit ribosomal protein S8
MMIDPIADMLTHIRNASKALLPEVVVNYSQVKESIARILKQEGYIEECRVEGQVKKHIKLKLKYQGRKGVIEKLRRASRPGLRRYVRAVDIPRVLGGMGTVILSTPQGVMTGTEARKKNVGGELICYVW